MDIDKKNFFIDCHDSCTVLITNYKEIIYQIKEIYDSNNKKRSDFFHCQIKYSRDMIINMSRLY